MNITIEFTGAPRSVVGQKRISLSFAGQATYRDVVRRLAHDYPDLVGLVIDRDGETFLSSNMFVINGDLSTPAMLLDEVPPDGAHLILMSLITGGSEPLPSPRSPLTPEIRALLHVPDEQTLMERQKRSTSERRVTGIWLGLALGLVYGVISQLINHFYLPDLPLYHPFPGPWLTALLVMLLGGLLGWVSAWPENGLLGIFYGGLLAALVIDITTLIETVLESGNLDMVGTALFFIALPLIASLVMVIAAFLWALNWRQRLRREQGPRWLIGAIPLALLVLVGWLATTTAYPPDARTILTRTRDLIETGRTAAQPADLPPALRAARVGDFLGNASTDYTLQWDRDPTNRYAIPRPLGPSGQDALVIARFADGWTLVCLYTAPAAPPQCIGLDG